MSMGIGAYANLIALDEKLVIYEYGSYNLNETKYRNANHICDGIITIQRDCFSEPEIHEKIKKMPSGKKKLITKRIPVSVNYTKMIEDGLISIENCSNCWKLVDGDVSYDAMVVHLLYCIFNRYQIEAKVAEYISYNV